MCVSTQASFVQVVWLRLVRCSAADVLHSFSYVFCFFFFPEKKVTWSGIRHRENLAGLQESGQTWSVCVLEEGILHISAFSRRHFLIRASRSLCQPSKRKSKLPGNVTQSQDPYAMHTLSHQIYRRSGRIRTSGRGMICRDGRLGVGFRYFWHASNPIM